MMKGRIFFRKEKNLQFLFQNVSKKEEKTSLNMNSLFGMGIMTVCMGIAYLIA